MTYHEFQFYQMKFSKELVCDDARKCNGKNGAFFFSVGKALLLDGVCNAGSAVFAVIKS